MKRAFRPKGLLIMLMAIVALIMTSCDKEESPYAIGDFIVSFGIVEKSLDANSQLVIRLDNGDKFMPVTASPYLENLAVNQRVLVNFAPMDDLINPDKSKTILGKVNLIQNLPFKEVLQLTNANKDSLGTDPVNIRDSWITDESILTIDFTYFSKGAVHLINLAQNSMESSAPQPIVLEFLHNAMGDAPLYKSSGYVSFKLDRFKIVGQHKTDFIIRYTNFDGKKVDLPHTINY